MNFAYAHWQKKALENNYFTTYLSSNIESTYDIGSIKSNIFANPQY